MIYLDSAATSLLKPPSVHRAVSDALSGLSSPGRGGHAGAMAAAGVLYDCRETLAGFFGVAEPERVVFTFNATHGLNIAIKSLVKSGDRVVVSGYEHNAVMRPLHAIGARVDVASSPLFRPEAAVEAFSRKLEGAKAAVCTHVSNVFGYILPIRDIAALCRAQNVPLIVDASQSAGCIPLEFDALGAEYAAMPGHKGLLGPQGTGVLLCRNERGGTLIEGGTGSDSENVDMPRFLPDRLEAGTHNMPGVAGLLAGVRWLEKRKSGAVLNHEQQMCRMMCRLLSENPRMRVYAAEDADAQSGVLSVAVDGMDCEDVARILAEKGIAVRAGLHCAPLAHQTAGTLESGTVRFSFSPFTTVCDVKKTAAEMLHIKN